MDKALAHRCANAQSLLGARSDILMGPPGLLFGSTIVVFFLASLVVYFS
jgi:hypothetical protein